MKKLLLGIDIGTSACKVALFDDKGILIASETMTYPIIYPQPGWVEQDPNVWWDAAASTIKKIIDIHDVNAFEIAGIGISGQSWSAIPIDKNGEVLANTPIWLDTRAQEVCNRFKADIGENEIFELCGNPIHPTYTSPKIRWFKENRPEIYLRTYCFLQSNSFIAYRLTGRITQDFSQVYGFHCFNMQKGSFDLEITKAMGLDLRFFPEQIVHSHEVIGKVSREAARKTGLKHGTPVIAGGLDAACGSLGAGVLSPGQTQEQGGQAGGMSICLDAYVADPSLILGYHVVPKKWLLQGGSIGGGGVIRWFEKEFCEAERIIGKKNGTSSLAEMDIEAEQIPAGSEGVVFLPYMSGERSPIWDKNAKAVFFGLDYSKTRAHMIRACFESVAFSLKHNLDIAETAGAKVDTLYAVGGSANSQLWTQIKADVTQKRIEVTSADHSTTRGAAMLAGVGVGMFNDFEEAVERCVVTSRVYEPKKTNADIYEKNYSVYLTLYKQLKVLMNS